MDDLLSIETYGFKTWHPQIDHLPQQQLPSCHQSGNGPYLSLACHWLQSRRHRALLGQRGSLLAEWNAASERHAMLAKDQPTCYLSSPQTAVPTVVCSLWSASFAAGQCQWVKWIQMVWLKTFEHEAMTLIHNLISFVIICPFTLHAQVGRPKSAAISRWPLCFCLRCQKWQPLNCWYIINFPNILHYITLHYITLHYYIYIHIIIITSTRYRWLNCLLVVVSDIYPLTRRGPCRGSLWDCHGKFEVGCGDAQPMIKMTEKSDIDRLTCSNISICCDKNVYVC